MKTKFWKKPITAIICILLGSILFGLPFLMPEQLYTGLFKETMEYPILAKTSPSGKEAVYDDKGVIFVFKEDGKTIDYMIEAIDFGDNSYVTDLAFDENNHLFVSYLEKSKTSVRALREGIIEYDQSGEKVRELCEYNYQYRIGKPVKSPQIHGLNIVDGSLRYLYSDDTISSFVSTNLETYITTQEMEYQPENYNYIIWSDNLDDGSYVVLTINGSIGKLHVDGSLEVLYTSQFSYDEENTSEIISYVVGIGNDCYAQRGVDNQELCLITKDGITPVISSDDIRAMGPNGLDEYANGDFSVDENNGKSIVFSGERIYEYQDGSLVELFGESYSLPTLKILESLINCFFPVIGGLLLVIGCVLLIGDLMKWKITLLSKQLFTTIPIVILMGVALIISMTKSTESTYLKLLRQQMVAVNEMSVAMFDGDEIAKIKDCSSVDEGTIQKLQDKLCMMAGNSEETWNSDYSASIFVHNEDETMGYCIASSFGDFAPFASYVTLTGIQDENEPEPGSNTTFYVDDYGYYTEETADTPIYDSKGNLVAYLELSVSTRTMNERINEMIKKSMVYLAILIPLFVIALAMIAYINTRNLKRVSNAVGQISKGDFSARIDKFSKDEVGDICITVNKMAEQLDEYFEEKDKNEKFYYKFVPEKFRELLHKDNFTDLALGDAESVDLTVLFCDIRAFSLNSEMMTAKENFEFVNVIYGIAGPIVRAHNGFVDKYIGDAVMALFETADDAVAAGIELYRAVVLDPETAKNLQVSSINIGVGIHSGMARIGIVGEDERMSGTVISNTVNLSSRLESLTKKYHAGMLISKETLDRLTDAESFKTRYLGMIQVAGVNEVKAVYEVLDCLPDDLLEARLNTKMQFREAIRLYHLGNLSQAVEMLKEIQALPNTEELDPTIEMYIEYIEEEMSKQALTNHIFRFDRK